MFDVFRFDLAGAVTTQLIAKLAEIELSPLCEPTLNSLEAYQQRFELTQGVYLLHFDGVPTYAGKADNLLNRLGQHLAKLRGRLNMDLDRVTFKCLLLEASWSTAANEDALIKHFARLGQARWNGGGFGSNDPGRRRDGAAPSTFDLEYPINDQWPCEGIEDHTTVGVTLLSLKQQLPFLLRYEITLEEATLPLNLTGIPRTVRRLAIAVKDVLGPKWQLMRFNSHMTLYRTHRPYEFGQEEHL